MRWANKNLVAASLAGVLLWSPVTSAQEKNWTAVIAPPANGTAYAPREPISIRTPAKIPFDDLLRLGLEVDAIDVTPLLAFENNVFTYRPPQALAAGAHKLRLVETLPTGGVLERGTWTITVSGGTAAVAQAKSKALITASARNALEISQRLADRRVDGSISRLQVTGGGDGYATYNEGSWSLTGSANYFARSAKDRSPNRRRFDIGEYNFTGRFDNSEHFGQIALGHQSLATNNYILSGFNRRGLSASFGNSDKSLAVTGFGLRTDAIIGREDISGVNDSDNLVQGAIVKTNPIPAWGKDFTLGAIAYTGKGAATGTGVGGDTNPNEGTGWGVESEGYLVDRRVRIKGQFAHTDFEYGNVLVGDDEASGEAWSSSVAYTPVRNAKIGGEIMNMTVGGQYERVGTFFSSLANPSLGADRDGVSLYSDMSWSGLAMNAVGTYVTNNVDDLTGVPTDSSRSFQFSGNYSPTVTPPAAGQTNWLGQPFLNFNLSYNDNQREETPVGYLGADTDNQLRSVTLGGGSNYSNWGWQLAETVSAFEDQTATASDNKSFLTTLSGNWLPRASLGLQGGVQWNQIIDTDAETNSHNVNLNLGIQAELIPETLRLKANYNLNLLAGDGDTNNRTIANGEVEWTLLPPTVNRVGVSIVFQGLMENKEDNADATQNTTTWQVFSLLRLTAPLSY